MAVTPTGPALALVVVSITLLIFSWIFILLRVIARVRIRGFGADDWLMCFGQLVFTPLAVVTTIGAYNGIGTAKQYLTPAQESDGLKWFTIFQILYLLSTVPIKASICFAMMRITTHPIYRWILYGVIVLTTVAAFVCEMVVLTFCKPISALWAPTADAKCGDPSLFPNASYYLSANSIVTDWTCAILPAFIMWNVHLRFRIKASVAIVLGLGVFASSATLVRLPTILSYADPSNYLYGVSNIAIWSVVESGIGIIAGSLATLRPLLKYIPGLNHTGSTSGGGMTGGGGGATGKDHLGTSHALGTIRFTGGTTKGGSGDHDDDNRSRIGSGPQTTVQGGRGVVRGSSRSKNEWHELPEDDSDSQKYMLDNDAAADKVLSPGITVTTDFMQNMIKDSSDPSHRMQRRASDDYGF